MDFVVDGGAVRAEVGRPKTAAECVNLQDRTLGHTSTDIGPFRVEYELSAQQVAILQRMARFYTPELIDEVLRPALAHGADATNPSLRLLDWLTVNYAKRTKLCTISSDDTPFNVYQGYRAALHHFRRRLFDPFRRRLRLTVMHENGDLTSTIGQLQFLAWSHEHGILRFAREHSAEIEADMNAATALSRKARDEAARNGQKRKRRELSRACNAKVTVYAHPSVVKWD